MTAGTATKRPLGRLVGVDLRTYWQDEARDFTPWLAKEENLRLLGEAIRIPDLELAQTEVQVGSFKDDILARDQISDKYIVIENQLEETDHDHLGKLITYASGLEAVAIVWVAREICDEHRKALDWLNGLVGGAVAFFGLEVELWQIGDSEPAPKFNLVCQPNEWASSILPASGDGQVSETKLLQLEFWTAFVGYCKSKGSVLSFQKPHPRHWYVISIGRSGIQISLTVHTKAERVGCELYIKVEHSKQAFAGLLGDKERIEEELASPLEWQELPHRHASRVAQYRPGSILDRKQWPELHSWLKERAETFHKVFSPRVKALELEED